MPRHSMILMPHVINWQFYIYVYLSVCRLTNDSIIFEHLISICTLQSILSYVIFNYKNKYKALKYTDK